MASNPSPDRVPLDVIAPIIRQWIEKHTADHDETGKNQNSFNSYCVGDREGAYSILGFQCGVSGRILRRIVTGKVLGKAGQFVDTISFDTADKIITGINPWLWHTEETLKPHYGPLEVRLKELEQGYELPEGFDFDGLPRAKKYVWLNARQKVAA